MGELRFIGKPQAPQQGDGSPLAVLASLRSAGAGQLDPARFHYLEVLSERMQAGSGAVRRVLEDKLNAALAAYADRVRLARMAASDEAESLSVRHPDLRRELRRLLANGDIGGVRRLGVQADARAPCAPLAQLNQYIRSATQDGSEEGLGGDGDARSDMKSVRRFRETWRSMAAEHQVDQAVVRGPENAGPLNSHRLVLQSLALMRSLSPGYLRRFMSHVDSLMWLEQAGRTSSPAAGKPKAARRTRAAK